jgi:hypothetical protein
VFRTKSIDYYSNWGKPNNAVTSRKTVTDKNSNQHTTTNSDQKKYDLMRVSRLPAIKANHNQWYFKPLLACK